MADETGAGGSDPIDIQLVDKVSPTIAPKIQAIAEAAREADSSILRLRAQIQGLDASQVNKLTQAVEQNNAAYLKNETLLNKAVKAETDANIASTKLAASIQQKAAAELNAETALNRAIIAEGKATSVSVTREEKLVAEARAAQQAANAQAAYNAILEAQGVSITGRAGSPKGAVAGDTTLAGQLAAQQALEAEQSKLITSNQKFLASLQSEAATLGMSRSEILAYRAAQLGVANQAAPLIEKIKGVEEAENAVGEAAHGSSLKVRESFVLMREAIRGDTTRMAGSATLLAQAFGLLKFIASPVGLSILAVAAATGAVIVAMSRGQSEVAQYNNMLKATGDYAGYTFGALKQLEQETSQRLNVSLGRSADVYKLLVSSGKVYGSELNEIAQSSLRLGQLTGQDATSIASDFLKMQKGVTNYAIEFNSQYHLLTAAQIDYIRTLENQGRNEEAERQLSHDVYVAIANTGIEQLGFLERAWRSLGNTASSVWENLKSIGRDATAQEKVVGDLQNIANLQKQVKDGAGFSLDTVAGFGFPTLSSSQLQNQLTLAQKKLAIDQQEVGLSKTLSDGMSNFAREQQKGVEASQRLNGEWNVFDKNADIAAQKIKDFRNDLAAALKANPNDARALQDKANQPALEAAIRKKFDPADVKAENDAARAAEAHSRAIDKINVALADEQARMGMLKPIRDAQAIADRYEVSLAGTKIQMSEAEKAAILDKAKAIIQAKEVQQQEDRIYEQLLKPMEDYKNKLSAINILQQQNAITNREAAAQRLAATLALKEANDPLFKQTTGLAAQNQLLTLNSDAREIETAVYEAQLKAAEEGKPVEEGSIQRLRDMLKANQDIKLVSQQLDAIYSQNVGAMRQLAAQIVALDIAYKRGTISEGQFKLAQQQVGAEALRLKIQMGQADFSDTLLSGLSKVLQGYKGLLPTLADDFGNFFDGIANGAGQAFGAIITGSSTAQDAIHQLGVSVLSELVGALVKLGIQMLLQQAIGDSLAASALASASVMATEMATAWEPAAVSASIATFGGADAVGLEAYLAALAAGKIGSVGLPGFATGGMIQGPGTGTSDSVPIMASAGEFMVKATAVAQPGVLPLLMAINGGDPYNWLKAARVSVPHYASGGYVNAAQSVGRPLVLQFNNYGTSKEFDAEYLDENTVRIIARDEATKAVEKKTPQIMAKEAHNKNSHFRQIMASQTKISPRLGG